MLGFLRRHDLTTALATVEARLTTMEAQVESATMRAHELHEMTTRLVKRFETRIQREKEADCEDCPDAATIDDTTDRVTARRQARRFRGVS